MAARFLDLPSSNLQGLFEKLCACEYVSPNLGLWQEKIVSIWMRRDGCQINTIYLESVGILRPVTHNFLRILVVESFHDSDKVSAESQTTYVARLSTEIRIFSFAVQPRVNILCKVSRR